jgi:hypothetical protein
MDFHKYVLSDSIKSELTRLFLIGVGVFLFILFFQPFPLDNLEYNDRLLYVTGFGGISFALGCLILVIFPIIFPKWFKLSEWESGPPFILNALLFILTSTAFAFYIRYVGQIHLSLYVMFKVILVCSLPVVILFMMYKNKSLELIIASLKEQNTTYLLRFNEYERNGEDEKVEIFSENKSDKLSLKYKNIILIKSANNYIEIFFVENDIVEKKLIRNTLKNIEQQLVEKTNFIRCHRTSIVNNFYIEKLIRSYSGYGLKLSCLDEDVPVSRQYLMQIKEDISSYE